MPSWTEKQLQTILSRGKNVLVSAAAGSGKTAVLTERILRLVTEDRVPLKELLIVTFTEAAASEMKTRIATALSGASETDPFAESQLRQLGAAKIMTFHAFCLTVLKRYYYAIELDPSFRVADAKLAEALQEEAMDEVIAASFADEDADFRAAFTEFLLGYSDAKDERKVRGKILKTWQFIMTLPDPFVWLKRSVDALFVNEADLEEMPAVSFAKAEIAERFGRARFLTERTGVLLESLCLPGLAAKNAVDLETVSRIERLFLAGDQDGVRHALEDISFETFRAGSGEKEVFEGVKGLVKNRRDDVKAILKKEIAGSFFTQSMDEYAADIASIAPQARTLEILVRRFADIYARIKREEGVIDFSDFEHMALRILEDDTIAGDYKRRLSYIFIDEYQDSNYVQEALISRIARVNNVFMVGDVKQSIYSFRNAAPAIFLEKQNRYHVEDTEDSQDLRIDLSRNFRSKSGVVDAVNALFETVMERRYSGMDYDDEARLVRGISYEPEAEGKTYLHVIKKDADKELFDSDTEGEAALCARLIRDTVGKPFYDAKSGVTRPVRYGDIAILLRAARGAADIYRKTLDGLGIPAVTDRGEGYFETVEIDTFLGLLRAISNMRRDVPLTAAMCSVVFGFALSELAEIRLGKQDGFFHTAFLAYAENGTDAALREKCADMKVRLLRWRDEERFMRLDDFLWKLMRESGFYDYVLGLPRGELRQANLRALLDRAAGFQSGRVDGLRGFLAFIDKIKLRGEAPQVTLVTDGEDVCRIMTIHGSKGREFPVVILGGMGKSFSSGGYQDDSLLLHPDAGLSLYWEDYTTHTWKKTLLHAALKLRQYIDERAELIRLLYVAMTRAMDTLHMIGTMRDPEKLMECYGTEEADPSVDTDIFGASNYLQLLLPTALKRADVFDVAIVVPEQVKGDAYVEPGAADNQAHLPVCEGAVQGSAGRQSQAAGSGETPYVYPYAASAKLKSKYSVTELGRLQAAEESGRVAEMPVSAFGTDAPIFFMAGGKDEVAEDSGLAAVAGLTAAEKGTALHKALELLDFKEARLHRGDRLWFEAYLSHLAESGALSDAEAASVGVDVLMKFADSDLCARAASSDFLLKEAPFNMKLSHHEAGGHLTDEEIIVQGVIDCLFEEADGVVIVDYKSGWFDRSSYESESERIRAAYGAQLRLYRKAAELIFAKPVKESLIYMTRSGALISMSFGVF